MAQRIGSWAMAGIALAVLAPGAPAAPAPAQIAAARAAAAPPASQIPGTMDFPTVPESAKQPGDEKMSCYALKAEGDRLIADSTSAAQSMKDIQVSNAPAKAAAGVAAASGLARTVVGALGGAAAGAAAGVASDAAIIGSGKAARETMTREFNRKADAVATRQESSMDRAMWMYQLYRSKCQ